MKKISCGVIIQAADSYFVGKVTGGGYRWDIPKGVVDGDEKPIETARRECIEESGIDISTLNGKLSDLGQLSYMPGKDLHLFHLKINHQFNTRDCKCASMVDIPGRKPFPEICGYDWKPYDAFLNSLGKNMKRVIQDLNLNKTPRHSIGKP